MRFLLALLFVTGACLAAPRIAFAMARIEEVRRICDMSPVSATNPVLASVPECGIEIPASEYLGFVAAEGPIADAPRAATLPEKEALLQRLIDEHFFLWNAYRQQWDRREQVVSMMNGTRNILLMDALTTKEVNEKAAKPGDWERLARELRDRCFDKIRTVVSTESYTELKKAAKRLKSEPPESLAQSNSVHSSAAPELAGVSPEVIKLSLAKSELGTVTIGEFLQVYTRLSADRQPDLEKPDGVVEILKMIWGDAALVAEAKAQGLEKSTEFREGLQLNRNVLTRFQAQDHVTAEAVARLKTPEGQRAVREWYEAHLKDRYTYRDEQGKEQVVSFDTGHEGIENDYFDILREEVRAEEARALRKGRKLEINEAQLERMTVSLTHQDSMAQP